MSKASPNPEQGTLDTPSGPSSQSQRVLACVLCQQRKVKCDRKFPCANCIRFRVQCVPATLAPRQRKRRFPERELLKRIRMYEVLLRQNNVQFEPLHPNESKAEAHFGPNEEQAESARTDQSSSSTSGKHEEVNEIKQHPDAEDEDDGSSSDVNEVGVKKVWDQLFTDDNLLLGSRKTLAELSTLHPDPVQIFRLWQIYLNNVDPLLKVTHTPSLQPRLIEAASNMTNISPTLEPLMFSIYSMAVTSLATDECQTTFGSTKEDLLTKYQFGCQQALMNCGYLRTGDRECLTAFYLFLISIGPGTDPRSLSSLLGVAMRIAQRIGIHSESASAKCSVLEAEMRRRLWWSLKIFDSRIGELADHKTIVLDPAWDCKIPRNVNDSDMRAGMKEPPPVQGVSSEALFAVVRGELGEFVRHSKAYLGFTNPSLKYFLSETAPEDGEMATLQKMVEEKYLRLCNPENPLHFMTIWSTRLFIAKYSLIEHYWKYSGSYGDRTAAQRDRAIGYALAMLESDTKILASPLTKGFLWIVHFYFPLPAYIHILQDLRRRPSSKLADKAWEAMSDNYDVRVITHEKAESPIYDIFVKLVLPAWEAREATLNATPIPPRIVSYVREVVAQKEQSTQAGGIEHMNIGLDDLNIPTPMPMSMPMGLGNYGLLYGAGGQDSSTGTSFDPGPFNQFDWAAMDWDLAGRPAW
ncbi:hypothetical protein N7474_009757 [Penicillium riverlandense]|uniref:uncharacterized protein n=1 Tax=Penicillium riverlandense TaxID=1903569 RepID=UPI0025471C68|nr:uncharacterized protein N7474_009757 [Penicillium riverlandense]KAJ5808488.1 hypothetical protein N7474_009757 [Penicillium riverlandense]